MNNEEMKKKIIDVLRDNIEYETLADALIAAGFTFYDKKHRVLIEKPLLPPDDNAMFITTTPPPPEIIQLYSGEEVEQIVNERDEYKHRAAVAERVVREFAAQYGTEVEE